MAGKLSFPRNSIAGRQETNCIAAGLHVEEAAFGVIECEESQIRDYLESMILGKGYSPSQYVCFSYGGGGPLHTAGYTKGFSFEDILVPAWAAAFLLLAVGQQTLNTAMIKLLT